MITNKRRILIGLIWLASQAMAIDLDALLVPPPENFIMGYGSLVNSESRRQSLGHFVDAIPVRITPAFGYARAWNFRGERTKITVLGIEKVAQGPGKHINGVIYPVAGNDMTVWDLREAGYYRLEVPLEFIQVLSWRCIPQGAKVWIYVPKQPAEAEYEYPLLQSYMDVVLKGFLEYSEAFAQEFIETTSGFSGYWLNDRLLARRPWVFEKSFTKVDALLQPYVHLRKLPAVYAIEASKHARPGSTHSSMSKPIAAPK